MLLKRLLESNKNILILMTGTVLAQLVTVGVSPILTRIFSPNDFGLLAEITSYVAILSVFASLRLDLVIFEIEQKYFEILTSIVITLSITIGIILFFILLSFGSFFIQFSTVILTVIGLIFLSISNALINLLNVKGKYHLMSKIKFFTAIIASTTSIFFGYILKDSYGIIYGPLGGYLFTILVVIRSKNFYFKTHMKYIKPIFKKYWRYPSFILPSTLFSEISSNLPIVLITRIFEKSLAGHFLLAQKVTTLPFTFIGNAISEVYKKESAEAINVKGDCRDVYIKTFKKLFVVGIISATSAYVFSKYLFVLVFGREWLISAQLSSYFAVMCFFQIISSPLSHTIIYKNSHNRDLYLQIFRFAGTILGFVLGYLNDDFILSIKIYCYVFIIYYLLHSLLQYYSSKGLINT